MSIGILDGYRNIFYADKGIKRIILRQPVPADKKRVEEAQSQASDYTLKRYQWRGLRTVKKRGKPLSICDQPLFKGGLGTLYMIVEMDNVIVGFDKILFVEAGEVHKNTWDIDSGIVAENSIMIIDKFQRQGIGTQIAPLTTFIARHFGADWFVGVTYAKRGFVNIRMREGWEVPRVFPEKNQVAVRKRL